MTWYETDQKGIFSRPIGENEAFIKLLGDTGLPLNREHWAINSTATIAPIGSMASADLTSHFRRAWAHLRFQHPSLAAESDSDSKNFIYTVPADRDALDAWVSQTFSAAPDAHSSADVIATFQPTPYAKLVYIPRSGELLGHTSHWRSDGIGVMLLLDALLSIASGPLSDPASLPWGSEVERLAPSVEDAAAMPRDSTPALKERGAAAVGTFAHAAGAVGIPFRSAANADVLPGGTRSAASVFDSATTEKIVAACKEKGVSVTAAVHASVAGANYALADEESRHKHYSSTIRFALRPYLPEPYATPAYAAALYTTGWMKRVEPGSSWAERLREYQDEYRKGITRDFLDSHREYAAQLGEMIRNLSSQGGGGDPHPPSDVDISSIGVAEKLIQRSYGTSEAGFDVKAVSVGVEILSRQAVTFVWTFRDQLNLSAVYNESFHSADQMDSFISEVKKHLLDGLNIQDSEMNLP